MSKKNRNYITLEMTEDVINLIPFINIVDNSGKISIDDTSLIGGNNFVETGAMALGLFDTRVEETKENAEGASFPEEVCDRIEKAYKYLKENIYSIEKLLHQYSVIGKIEPGTYTCAKNEYIFTRDN